MTEATDTITRTLRIPLGLWRDIRIEAAREEKSANEWIRESLELVLTRVKKTHA
jgi:predicted HicB family RNase H-like nuclease